MIEVEVENFQSIERASFKIDGFTVLVGRSNIGKSALVRAIRNALTGAAGTDFVRHGPSCERRLKDNKRCKCQTRVRIATPQLELVWEKGDAVNRYTVVRPGEAPVLYDKVDRGTPEFLRPGFSPIKVGDDQVLLQVSEQFDPIFLLNMSGPTVAEVLSDVARLDDINKATSLVSKDRKEAMSTRSVREKDVVELAKSLTSYDGLDPLVEDIRNIEVRHAAVQTKEQQLANANRLLGELEAMARSILALQAATKPAPPDRLKLQKTNERYSEVVRLNDELAIRTAVVEGLQAATKPEPPDDARLRTASSHYSKVVRFNEELEVRTAAVDRLSPVEGILVPAVDPLKTSLTKFKQVDDWLGKAQALKTDFDRLKRLEGVKDPDPKAITATYDRFKMADTALKRLVALATAIQALEDEVAAAEKDEAKAIEELRDLGVCPTCSQGISPEHHLHLEAP